MRLSIVYILAFALFWAGPALSQGWQPLLPSAGAGGLSCAQSGGMQACLAFRCDSERGLEFQLLRNHSAPTIPDQVVMQVDGGPQRVIFFRQVKGVQGQIANVDFGDWGFDLLQSLGSGAALTVTAEAQYRFGLLGARGAMERAITQCASRDYAVIKSFDDLAKGPKYPIPIPDTDIKLKYLHKTDSWGQDIDGGLSNPALRGISGNQCVARCLARADCALVTYNTAKNVCFLKSGFGTLRRTEEATTVFIERRPLVVRSPLVAGVGPVLMDGLRARADEPWQTYLARLRQASAPMGGDCQQEANEMGRIAQSLTLTPPASNSVAGEVVQLGWSGALMTRRVPAWLVISADRPVRFEGDGAFALNAGGLGPFGIAQDGDRQRAFVPLFEGPLAQAGQLGIKPLEAGPLNVRVTMASYLRRCQQELPLAQAEWHVNVTPAAPQIVLRDLTAAHPFDRRIDVPEYGRRIVLNDTQFQILHSADGSEILSREGKDLRLSPTKRFVVVHDGGEYDIIDIVDGAVVRSFNALGRDYGIAMLGFWNADSFYVSDSTPSGVINLGSTVLPKALITGQQTGASCCYNGGNSAVSVNLENNLVTVADASFSLLDGGLLGTNEPPDYFPKRASGLGSSVQPFALTAMGLVAPVDTQAKWNMPLGPMFVHGYNYGNIRKEEDAEDRAIMAMAQTDPTYPPDPDFGKSLRRNTATRPTAVINRGGEATTMQVAGFRSALSRWGVELAAEVYPTKWLDRYENSNNGGEIDATPAFGLTKRQIEADLAKEGLRANWSPPDIEKYGSANFCEHFPNAERSESGLVQAPYEMNLAYRFWLEQRTIWVIRARCDGGATGASIMHLSSLIVFDSQVKKEALGSYRVDNAGSGFVEVESVLDSGAFELGFDAKLVADRLLVTYAPEEGAIIVYDLTDRDFVLHLPYARRGDLLQNVYVDTALEHLFQLNSDGSFTIYRLSDGAAILEGRYLDDELVVWTADFRFDATEEGAAFVELRFPGRAGQFSFQQFDGALRVKGLMQAALSGAPLTLDKRVAGVPPEVTGWLRAQGPRITGVLHAQGSASLKSVRLFQDGVLTDSFTADGAGLVAVDVERRTGVRWTSVLVEDTVGLVSLPLEADLGADPRGRPGLLFMGVGIDYYRDPALEALNFAKVDALRLSDSFAALDGGRLRLKSNAVLTDRRAGRAAILETVGAMLAQAEAGDHVIMFFAGHGLKDDAGNFYLGLSGTQVSDLQGTALSWRDLAARIAPSGVRVTVLLDACHAGAAGTGLFATNDAAVSGLMEALAGNITVLSAAKGRQFSGESAGAGGGYFTQAIREVLLDKQARFDDNGNGVLEMTELYRGVKSQVVAHRGAMQTPWLSRNQLVGENGLF